MIDIEEQLVRAYADERFPLPNAALAGLVRRRRRRLGLVTLAACLATVGIGTVLGQMATAPAPSTTDPAALSAEAAACHEHVDLPLSQPMVEFRLVDPDDPDNRLVVVADTRHVVACTPQGTILLLPDDPSTGQALLDSGQLDFEYYSQPGHGLIVVGTTPPGTDRVEVVLPDGASLPVQVRDGWFAAWQPVTAYGTDHYRSLQVYAYAATPRHD